VYGLKLVVNSIEFLSRPRKTKLRGVQADPTVVVPLLKSTEAIGVVLLKVEETSVEEAVVAEVAGAVHKNDIPLGMTESE